ncbi:MAG TPA: hypothetical protein PL072_08015 [Phycisphaerales bacterium]|nr:hypothetical protein [Phycisphaerales bacterium]
MSRQPKRNLLAECAIAVLVCGAAQYFVAQPVSRSLAAVRDRVTQLGATGAGGVTGVDARAVSGLIDDIRSAADRIDERNAVLRGPSALLDELTRAAEACSVKLVEVRPLQTVAIEPKPDPAAAAASAVPGAPPPAPAYRDLRSTCHLTVQGSYGAVLAFAKSLSEQIGFTQVASLQVTPAGDGPRDAVLAQMQVHQYQFDTQPVRRATANAGHTPPRSAASPSMQGVQP